MSFPFLKQTFRRLHYEQTCLRVVVGAGLGLKARPRELLQRDDKTAWLETNGGVSAVATFNVQAGLNKSGFQRSCGSKQVQMWPFSPRLRPESAESRPASPGACALSLLLLLFLFQNRIADRTSCLSHPGWLTAHMVAGCGEGLNLTSDLSQRRRRLLSLHFLLSLKNRPSEVLRRATKAR